MHSNPRILGTDSAADNKGASWQTPLLNQAELYLPFAVEVLDLRSCK